MDNEVLINIKNLKKYFKVEKIGLQLSSGEVRAVDDVNLDIKKGETFGLVGESGCGKSTLGKLIVKLLEPTSGHVFFKKTDITISSKDELKKLRKKIQIIFQDPASSLNPRKTLQQILIEPFIIHKVFTRREREQKIINLLDLTAIPSYFLKRYPYELSGGQKQRVGIARALMLNPEFIICDEAVSALDVSVQAQIINLLEDLKKEFSLTYLFISHDLSVVYNISNRVAVMYLGKIIEIASTKELYSNPLHPYTQGLLAAIPRINSKAQNQNLLLKGDVSALSKAPSGCRFSSRCYKSFDRCKVHEPTLSKVNEDHFVACNLYPCD